MSTNSLLNSKPQNFRPTKINDFIVPIGSFDFNKEQTQFNPSLFMTSDGTPVADEFLLNSSPYIALQMYQATFHTTQ